MFILTATMKVEMHRPFLALSRFFSRRNVDADIDISRVFFPAWYGRLSYASNPRRWGSGVRIDAGIVMANFSEVERWDDVRYVLIVEFDEGGVKSVDDRGMNGVYSSLDFAWVLHLGCAGQSASHACQIVSASLQLVGGLRLSLTFKPHWSPTDEEVACVEDGRREGTKQSWGSMTLTKGREGKGREGKGKGMIWGSVERGRDEEG